MSMSPEQHKKVVIGVVRGTQVAAGRRNRRRSSSGKMKCEATLHQGSLLSLPLSSFSNKANNSSGMRRSQLDVYSAEILEYRKGTGKIAKHTEDIGYFLYGETGGALQLLS